MTKHTPGPWVAHVSNVDEETGNEVMLIRSESPMRGIASFELEDEEAEANAHLIAAAPELLEAAIIAQFVLFHIHPVKTDDNHNEKIAALEKAQFLLLNAIAKAEGGD